MVVALLHPRRAAGRGRQLQRRPASVQRRSVVLLLSTRRKTHPARGAAGWPWASWALSTGHQRGYCFGTPARKERGREEAKARRLLFFFRRALRRRSSRVRKARARRAQRSWERRRFRRLGASKRWKRCWGSGGEAKEKEVEARRGHRAGRGRRRRRRGERERDPTRRRPKTTRTAFFLHN